jgi:hypothetical protein
VCVTDADLRDVITRLGLHHCSFPLVLRHFFPFGIILLLFRLHS